MGAIDLEQIMPENPRPDVKETVRDIRSLVGQVIADGYGDCKLCGQRFHGDFGQVLQQLGEHGEIAHPGHEKEPGE
jgi:hypothetical protein